MNGNFKGDVAPVREGEEHDVRVEGVGEKGDGIARVKGFVLFIPGVKTGDEVRIKITRVLAKVGFAEVTGKVEKITEPIKEAPKPEEPSEEEKALFDETKDSDDFGEEKTETKASEAEQTKTVKQTKKAKLAKKSKK
ncbi:MAG: TRAM domain-containing protein [archaeon]